jgi:hypothetical protein
LQTSVNNIRNLHGGLRRQGRGSRERTGRDASRSRRPSERRTQHDRSRSLRRATLG